MQFKQYGKIKKVRGRRHINLGEVRAGLAAEKKISQELPDHYYMHLQDSQVSLACMTKGRSSSQAINKELKKSIPTVVGANVRGYYGFIRSKSNPADDPTRKQPVRKPTRLPPRWWTEAEDGRFEELDKFLEENLVHPTQVSELPDPKELLADVQLDGRSSKDVKKERGRRLRKERISKQEETDEAVERLQEGSKAVDEDFKNASEQRSLLRSTEAESTEAERTAEEEGEKQRAEKVADSTKEGASSEETRQRLRGTWLEGREELWAALTSFKRSQFVLQEGVEDLDSALLKGPGLLDLFSGKRGFAQAFAKMGCSWALCFDLKHGEDENLLEPNLQARLKSLLGSRCFIAMAASPVCASFSTAITPPWRMKIWPRGKPGLTEEQLEKIRLGHEQLAFTLELVRVCLRHGVIFWIENPEQSWFWKIDKELSWDDILARGDVGDFRVDQCVFGTPWRKRTRFRTNSHLRDQKQLCRCTKPHVKLRGRSKQHGMNFTKLAESYPRKLCSVLAAAVAIDCGLKADCRNVSVSDCVFCNNKRIGEASNPGPRRRQMPRDGDIDDIQLLEPQTVKMRSKLWDAFNIWINENIGEGALEHMLESPGLLVKTLEAYGKAQFSGGAPLHYYRQLLAHTQREYPLCRPFMQGAWLVVTKWEQAEPTQHRPPIPEPLAVAISALALLWRWPKFASTVLMCFFSILRIGEVLNARRRDLLTPNDLMSPEPEIFLKISNPKSRGRGPRIQYSTFKKVEFLPILLHTWEGLKPGERLYPLSASAFRRRWDCILQHLGVQSFHRLTPGAMRPGGAVWAHRQGMSIQDLLWKMRLQHLRTLGYYLQEVTAVSILPNLTAECRGNIAALLGIMPFLSEHSSAHNPRRDCCFNL